MPKLANELGAMAVTKLRKPGLHFIGGFRGWPYRSRDMALGEAGFVAQWWPAEGLRWGWVRIPTSRSPKPVTSLVRHVN